MAHDPPKVKISSSSMWPRSSSSFFGRIPGCIRAESELSMFTCCKLKIVTEHERAGDKKDPPKKGRQQTSFTAASMESKLALAELQPQ